MYKSLFPNSNNLSTIKNAYLYLPNGDVYNQYVSFDTKNWWKNNEKTYDIHFKIQKELLDNGTKNFLNFKLYS